MKISRNVVVLCAVAGGAFLAGRVLTFAGSESAAQAQDRKNPSQLSDKMAPKKDKAHKDMGQGDRAMTEEEMAWMKFMTPGEHHEHLNHLVGTWEGEVKIWMEPGAEPTSWPGTVTREWTLDGRFLHETVAAESPEFGPFKGLGYLGYNNYDGVYEMAWMENMSTAITTATGTYDPDAKKFFFSGEHRDPVSGRLVKSWSEVDVSNPYRQSFIGWEIGPDGRKRKNMEGTFKKK